MGDDTKRSAAIHPGLTALASGTAAEDLAYLYLKNKGLRLLTRNYRSKGGEVDLIMQDKKQVVFIEVRFRTHTNFGAASETVSRLKQKRLITTAWQYLFEHNQANQANCRFDVVGIDGKQQITWIKNAFEG